jgi:dTDP-4-dehydrorhamnose reductase
MDITDAGAVERTIQRMQPWAVINAAGYVRVDQAESEPERCYLENVTGARTLAETCARHGIGYVTFSSDLVFDGARRQPYIETDTPGPLSIYGKSKAEAEKRVREAMPKALIARTSAFFGPWDEANFVTVTLRQMAAGHCVVAASDAVVSPTYIPDLVHACLDLLIDGEHGVWHLANEGAVSWAELASLAAGMAGLEASLVAGCPTRSLRLAASRPLHSALASERGQLLRPLREAIECYLRDCGIDWRSLAAASEHVPGKRRGDTAAWAGENSARSGAPSASLAWREER